MLQPELHNLAFNLHLLKRTTLAKLHVDLVTDKPTANTLEELGLVEHMLEAINAPGILLQKGHVEERLREEMSYKDICEAMFKVRRADTGGTSEEGQEVPAEVEVVGSVSGEEQNRADEEYRREGDDHTEGEKRLEENPARDDHEHDEE